MGKQPLSKDQQQALYGFGQASVGHWTKVIALQLERIERHQRYLVDLLEIPEEDGRPHRLNDAPAHIEIAWLIRTDAHFLFLAIRHLLRYAELCEGGLTDRDPNVKGALRMFTTSWPEVVAIRDGLEHLDERVRHRATPENLQPVALGTIEPVGDDPLGELVYCFEEHAVPLKAVANAAIAMGRRVDEIFEEKMFGVKLLSQNFPRSHTI